MNNSIYIDILEDMRHQALADESELRVGLFSEPKVTAPEWMKRAVKKGKKIRDEQPESGKCCTDVGLRRANQIENGETLSLSTLNRMKSFAARHGGQAEWDRPDSKRAQSLLLWGVPYSKSGLDKFVKWVNLKIKMLESERS